MIFFTASTCSGDAQYRLDRWTAERGLPENIITGVTQTPDSYLWLTTFDGLVRFDGVRFTVFDRSNIPALRSNRLSALYQAFDGTLWLGTEGGGLMSFRGGAVKAYGTEQGLPTSTVRSITGDKQGRIWALSDGTIAELRPHEGLFALILASPKSHFDAILWDMGGFWQAHDRQLQCFMEGALTVIPLSKDVPGSSITKVARDRLGIFWVELEDGRQGILRNGTLEQRPVSHGVVDVNYRDDFGTRWDIRVGRHLGRYIQDTSSGSPNDVQFSTSFNDREGNLWLATNGQGLYRAQLQSIRTYSVKDGLIDRDVYPILQDNTGAIWIGAWPGGLSRYDGKDFASFAEESGLARGNATALAEDSHNRLWVATHGGVRIRTGGRFQKAPGLTIPEHAVVQAILSDTSGTVWLGTNHGLVRYRDGKSTLFSTADGLVSEDIRVIVAGRTGELWVGGFGGLSRLQNDVFQHWGLRDGLPSDTIRAIYEDREGIVWIGTYDGGLARFAKNNFFSYTKRNGLFSNGVFQILEDSNDTFWMSSNQGIFRVSRRSLNELANGLINKLTYTAYGLADGMLNVECNGGLWPAGIKTKTGKLWFPTQDGVAVIDPATISVNPHPPPVVIESLTIDREPARLAGTVEVASSKHSFDISYTALSFINSEQLRFKYKLSPLETDWVEAGERRTAYYSHVPPGDYTFTVLAENRDGVWDLVGQQMSISVDAPFYRKWWFQLVPFIMLLLLFTLAWRFRASRLASAQAQQYKFSSQLITSQETERKRIAAELHDSLGQRLVIIKNLAAFSLKAPGGSKPGFDLEALEEISLEASQAINETREISYNLRPLQLDRLGLSKAIEGLVRRVSNASEILFTSKVADIDSVLREEHRINFYRIIQESLNNVVKHSRATSATVTVELRRDVLNLIVSDDGIGMVPGDNLRKSESAGFGLTGMEERARVLGGTFAIVPATPRGTMVTVTIPIRGSIHA